MSSARVWLRGFFELTVWSHHNTAKVPPRFQAIYTLVLPFIYACLATYGLVSIGFPIGSIDFTFGVIYGDLWSFSLFVAGLASFLGMAFYARLIWVEIVAQCCVVALMLSYLFCLFLAAIQGFEGFRILSLLIVVVTMPLPAWRIYDMVRELRPPVHVS